MKPVNTICILAWLLIIFPAASLYAGDGISNQDLCESPLISQIQKGKSTQQDVARLIGEPDDIELLFNNRQVWKYVRAQSRIGSSAGQSSFGTSTNSDGIGQGRSIFNSRIKKCNLHLVFDEHGVVKKVRIGDISGRVEMGN